MNTQKYFDYIEDKLSHLVSRIELRGKLNILNLHLHSEDFYLHFLNTLFGWQLKNCNATKQNVEAIDLIDVVNKIVVQVSATATKAKVESALTKDLSQFTGYRFKFVSISKDASNLKLMTFKNPFGLTFDKATDIYDVPSILREINGLRASELKPVYEFIKEELGDDSVEYQLETNLATIIGTLGQEDLNDDSASPQINEFEIERKLTLNNLSIAKELVEEFKVHTSRLDRIYSEFDKSGMNKSTSVLGSIRGEYLKHRKIQNDDDLFFKVIDCVIDKTRSSANFVKMPLDELEQCVKVLVVDAFIRCKIFKNPKDYDHVAA